MSDFMFQAHEWAKVSLPEYLDEHLDDNKALDVIELRDTVGTDLAGLGETFLSGVIEKAEVYERGMEALYVCGLAHHADYPEVNAVALDNEKAEVPLVELIGAAIDASPPSRLNIQPEDVENIDDVLREASRMIAVAAGKMATGQTLQYGQSLAVETGIFDAEGLEGRIVGQLKDLVNKQLRELYSDIVVKEATVNRPALYHALEQAHALTRIGQILSRSRLGKEAQGLSRLPREVYPYDVLERSLTDWHTNSQRKRVGVTIQSLGMLLTKKSVAYN